MDKIECINRIEKILMESKKPSVELRELMTGERVFEKYPLNYLWGLKDIMQNKKHHPEGDVLTHTLMVVDEATKRKKIVEDKHVFMWAALLHDIGKLKTTKKRNGRLTAYNHDKVGAEMATEFLKYFNFNEKFSENVIALVRWHMQPLFVVNKLPFAEVDNMMKEINIKELAKLSTCDRLGRRGLDEKDEKEEKDKISKFVEIVEKY